MESTWNWFKEGVKYLFTPKVSNNNDQNSSNSSSSNNSGGDQYTNQTKAVDQNQNSQSQVNLVQKEQIQEQLYQQNITKENKKQEQKIQKTKDIKIDQRSQKELKVLDKQQDDIENIQKLVTMIKSGKSPAQITKFIKELKGLQQLLQKQPEMLKKMPIGKEINKLQQTLQRQQNRINVKARELIPDKGLFVPNKQRASYQSQQSSPLYQQNQKVIQRTSQLSKQHSNLQRIQNLSQSNARFEQQKKRKQMLKTKQKPLGMPGAQNLKEEKKITENNQIKESNEKIQKEQQVRQKELQKSMEEKKDVQQVGNKINLQDQEQKQTLLSKNQEQMHNTKQKPKDKNRQDLNAEKSVHEREIEAKIKEMKARLLEIDNMPEFTAEQIRKKQELLGQFVNQVDHTFMVGVMEGSRQMIENQARELEGAMDIPEEQKEQQASKELHAEMDAKREELNNTRLNILFEKVIPLLENELVLKEPELDKQSEQNYEPEFENIQFNENNIEHEDIQEEYVNEDIEEDGVTEVEEEKGSEQQVNGGQQKSSEQKEATQIVAEQINKTLLRQKPQQGQKTQNPKFAQFDKIMMNQNLQGLDLAGLNNIQNNQKSFGKFTERELASKSGKGVGSVAGIS